MEQSQKRSDIIKAAKLYYYGNMSQNEIANLMGISRPKVSRLLTEAKQLKIVQIEIKDGAGSLEHVAEKIKNYFALDAVIVVPSGNSEDDAKANAGKAASQLLNDRLRKDMKIGLSWGTTLLAFVREFKAKVPVPEAMVVQLVGGSFSKELNLDAGDLVNRLSTKLRCRVSALHSPYIVSNCALRNLLMQEPELIEHFDNVHKVDIAFVGIGIVQDVKSSVVYKANYITEEEAGTLSSMGYVADICGHPFLPDGSATENLLTSRIIGISPAELRQIPNVVGLGVGIRKVSSIRAAARSRCINTLIIDEVAAIAMMAAEGIE